MSQVQVLRNVLDELSQTRRVFDGLSLPMAQLLLGIESVIVLCVSLVVFYLEGRARDSLLL